MLRVNVIKFSYLQTQIEVEKVLYSKVNIYKFLHSIPPYFILAG